MADGHTFAASPSLEVLALNKDQVSEFIRKKRNTKELSHIVALLNADIMNGTEKVKKEAAAALKKLGFTLD